MTSNVDVILGLVDALRMAWFRRRPESSLIFHTDRGASIVAMRFRKPWLDMACKAWRPHATSRLQHPDAVRENGLVAQLQNTA